VIKTAVTNLLLRSEEFGTTWSPLNVTVSADTSASPTGSLTADTITPAASAAAHLISQTATVPASMPHTASVYIKSDGAPFVQVAYDNGSSVGAFINVNTSTGAITRGPDAAGGATGTTGSVTSVGNGWYRINVGATHTGTIGRILVSPLSSGSSTASINPSTTTAVTDKVILWGAQLEQSSSVGEYIPTTSTINSAPRFDHNPTTGESLGLLVEEQRTNLLTQSQDLAASVGTTVTLNAASSPLGTTTAVVIIEDSSTGNHSFGTTSATVSAVSTTCSFFAKANGRNWIALRFAGTTRAWFNISTGQVGTVDAGTSATTVQAFPNGFYRCSCTFTPAAGAANIFMRMGTADTTDSYTGDNTSGVILFGFQIEAGAFPTSYIPTTTAAVTRNADVASITGIDTASWYNHLEGTICTAVSYSGGNVTSNGLGYANGVLKFAEAGVSNFSRVIRLATQNTPDSHSLVQRNSTSSYLANENTIGDLQVGRVYRYSGSYVDNSTSGLAFVVDGGTVRTSSTAAAIPQATRLLIGRGNSGTVEGSPDADNQYCNGTIRRLTYWPTRLPDSTLQTLTQ
jgi:hypothetical protein